MVRAFSEFRELLHARSVLHVRQSRGSREADSAARDDPEAGKAFSRPLRSYASVVLGDHLYTSLPGKVWYISDIRLDGELRARLRRADIAEVAVLHLETGPAHGDFLELEFAAPVPPHDRTLLEIMGPLIAEAWQQRRPGAVRAMMSGRPSRVASERPAAEAKAILDPDNPAGLTRSEFHICVLIHEGRLPGEIARKLNVKTTTLRSHMRSIYLKTGVSGQVELVHRLHGAIAAISNRA